MSMTKTPKCECGNKLDFWGYKQYLQSGEPVVECKKCFKRLK